MEYAIYIYTPGNRSKGIKKDQSNSLISILQDAIMKLEENHVIAVKIMKNNRKIALLRK